MGCKLLEQIMDIIVHMHVDTDNIHYRIFASQDDYDEIRSSVHSFAEVPEIEPTDYMDGRCLYYCNGFKLLVELDKDREDGKPVIITN